MDIKLKDGFVSRGEKIYHLKLRRLTVGDLIDAETESESPVMTPVGIKLLSSSAVMGYELVRRSVCKVGDLDRGLLQQELREFSEDDFTILKNAYNALNPFTSEAGMSDEGRDAAAAQ